MSRAFACQARILALRTSAVVDGELTALTMANHIQFNVEKQVRLFNGWSHPNGRHF
jgi:hypothetical protein